MFYTVTKIVTCAVLLASSCSAQLWTSILSTQRAFDWSTAGVIGGIPTRNTIYATLTSSASASTINSNLASCPSGEVVYLSAGTYANLGAINWSTACTLRGAGADQTILQFASDASCNGGSASICMTSTDNNHATGPSNGRVTVTGASAGATSITLASVVNLNIGNPLIIDICDTGLSVQAAPNGTCTGTVTDSGAIFVTDSTSSGTGVSPGLSGPYSTEGNSGGAMLETRQNFQIVRVTGCNGNVTVGTACTGTNTAVTISPALNQMPWDSTSQAWWSTSPALGLGLENLTVDNTNVTNAGQCSGGDGIELANAQNSWVTGVRDIDSNMLHVNLTYANHNTIRNNYFYLTQNWATCSYGVGQFMGSDNLIENNIFQAVASPIIRNGATGTVSDYNFGVNMFFNGSTYQSNFDADHTSGTAYNLSEGNISNYFDADAIHGTHQFDTVLRNYYSGNQPVCWISSTNTATSVTALATGTFGACDNPLSAVYVSSFGRGMNFVGNILGATGIQDGYKTGSFPVYAFGAGNSPVPDDPNVAISALLWGNCDAITGFGSCRFVSSEVPTTLTGAQTIYNQSVPSGMTIPSSFYYSSKPSWWPSAKPWPIIGPDVTGGNISNVNGTVYTNPAEDCYLTTMGGMPDGTGLVLTFNSNTCYPTSALIGSYASGLTISGGSVR